MELKGQGYRIELQEDDNPVELHVLARAYRDAWLALMLYPPVGRHRFEKLGVTIEYELPKNA